MRRELGCGFEVPRRVGGLGHDLKFKSDCFVPLTYATPSVRNESVWLPKFRANTSCNCRIYATFPRESGMEKIPKIPQLANADGSHVI